MPIVTRRSNRFNKLIRLLREIATSDRNKLIYFLVKEKGSTYQEIANVLQTTRQHIHRINKEQEVKNGTN